MKAFWALTVLFGAFTATSALQAQDRKITEVVKLLQGMLEKSQHEGDIERELFGKYKCYCDTNKAEKEALIERLTEEIEVLEAKIEELQAHNGELSREVAKLDADMKQNAQDREEATSIRNKEHSEFVSKEADLVQAIAQMDDAIKVLSDIGADQSLNTAQDHAQYMAGGGASLLKLRASLEAALLAASAFVTRKQVVPVEAFIQAPFTGTYSARSGEVVGILKDMRDTFTANLKEARETEARAQAAYDKYMEEMLAAYTAMEAAFHTKQGQLSSNDGALAATRDQLAAAEATKAEAEDFLAKLLDMCAAKKKQYDERVNLRSQEQAAISEAVAILNSDAAFATFGTVSATSSGLEFFQRQSTVRRHRLLRRADGAAGEPARKAVGFLQAAESVKGSSPLLGRIVAMIQARNPFKVVLAEIEKMIKLIEKEGEADAEQKQWCVKERRDTRAAIVVAEGKIRDLNTAIDSLTTLIHDPAAGLLVQIKNTEDDLQTNYDSQVSETKTRKEENSAYQKDVANLQEAQALISQAIKVLAKYYSKITDEVKAAELAQVRRDDPAPPATWEDRYSGQSQSGGVSAVSMLQFILQNTRAEETQAHADELSSQHDYEDSMAQLKQQEAQLQDSLARLRQQLAEAEKELALKREDLAKTEEEKAALESYLEKIKPGCDFIEANLDSRVLARTKETSALEDARSSLKGSPAFQRYVEDQHQEDLGDCREICAKSEDHVDCKACLAKVSVPGFCAGHPSTEGC